MLYLKKIVPLSNTVFIRPIFWKCSVQTKQCLSHSLIYQNRTYSWTNILCWSRNNIPINPISPDSNPTSFSRNNSRCWSRNMSCLCKSNPPYHSKSNYSQYLSPSLTLFLTNIGELQVTQESSEEVSRSGCILLHRNTARLIGCKWWCHFNV